MSGPKRADVQSQLNIVVGSIRNSCKLLHSSNSTNINKIAKASEKNVKQANTKLRVLVDIFNELSEKHDDDSVGDITALRKEIEELREYLVNSKDAINLAVETTNQTGIEIKEAEKIFSEAEKKSRVIEEAIRNKPHYCHDEMNQAQQLCIDIERAQEISALANSKAKIAENNAIKATANINEVSRRSSLLIDKAEKIQQGIKARSKAKKEAELILEKKKREAKISLEYVKTSINKINVEEDTQLLGDIITRLVTNLNSLQTSYNNGNYDYVIDNSPTVGSQINKVYEEVLSKKREIEKKSALIEENLNALQTIVTNIDKQIIENWNDESNVILEIDSISSRVNELKGQYKLDEAINLIDITKERISNGVEKAIKNIENSEKRENTGRVIMEVLHDMGFDVSFDHGDLNKPMQISAQTVDINGRGDVEVSLPLGGEVDFLVETHEGDISCVAAIKELEDRLRERGVNWNTTDWGHASGAKIVKSSIKETIKERVKTKIKK